MMLEDEGHEVRSGRDGRDGYLISLQFNPDLVITDIQMPGENGIVLMENIRKHNPRVRTIYMSGDLNRFGFSLEEEKKREQVRLLEKPFSMVELLRLLYFFSSQRGKDEREN